MIAELREALAESRRAAELLQHQVGQTAQAARNDAQRSEAMEHELSGRRNSEAFHGEAAPSLR